MRPLPEIDREIKESASICEKNFACISDENHSLCIVEHYINSNIIFIKCLDAKHCAYKMAFGFSLWICNCPVRKEIYKKYKI